MKTIAHKVSKRPYSQQKKRTMELKKDKEIEALELETKEKISEYFEIIKNEAGSDPAHL